MNRNPAAAPWTIQFAPLESPLQSASSSQEVDRSIRPLGFGPLCQLLNVFVVAVVTTPLWLQTPAWMQTSLIGCTWGALVLAGLGCSWSRQRVSSALYALFLAGLSHRSLMVLTDFEHNASWLLVICILASGWCVGWVITPWSSEHREPTCLAQGGDSCRRMSRWSIWDIGGLATLVGTLCWLCPRIENQIDLFCQVAPALVGGLLVSSMAVEWAWRDRWSLPRLAAMAFVLAALCAMCWWFAPSSLDTQAVLGWIVAAPASVMAAQALTVLSTMAALRIDMYLASAASVKQLCALKLQRQ